MRSTVSSRRRTALLYAGVIVFLLLAIFTARSIAVAWRARSGDAKAEAILNLVAERTAPRPTAAPGAMAWLRLELDRYERHIGDPSRAAIYRGLAAPAGRVPDVLGPIATTLVATPASSGERALRTVPLPVTTGAVTPSLRRQQLVMLGDRTFVVTRRRPLDAAADAPTESNRFVRAIVPVLDERQRAISRLLAEHPLPSVPDTRSPRPVRVYAVSEDGTLVSSPWDDERPQDVVVRQELALLSERPGLPAFAPEDFFFHFSPSTPAPPAYSGFYLDLGGRGLVSTITAPVEQPADTHAVLALDLAFEIDWQTLAAAVEAPVVGTSVRVSDGANASWTSLASALPAAAPPPLRQAVDALAGIERQSGIRDDASPLRHGIVPAGGAVAAFQVSDANWLLMYFPPASPSFPLTAVILLAGVLALLLAGFERNRRRAEDERQNAERALGEKQNLLNTMQIPLVVVDPNSDVIVSANRAAESIGVLAGARFADIVWPDERSRSHYERMQVASPEPRRAYGLPVAVRDERGAVTKRYAVIRSVAVTAPIEALNADERHRLGVVFVLDEDDDLALFAGAIGEHAHRDERQRLAGLLSHGVDTLARVLEHSLGTANSTSPQAAFSGWLAEYLERRLTVTAWLLDHWDAATPLPREHVVDAGQARATLDRLTAVLGIVRDDRELRSRLHWDNGTLASAGPGRPVLDVQIDWPSTFEITTPVRGGLGMFLGEVVTNAVRHGAPSSVPRVRITHDPVRRELTFRIENDTTGASVAPPDGEAYGGISILRALARLFEWRDLTFTPSAGRFVAEWRVGASVRGKHDQAD